MRGDAAAVEDAIEAEAAAAAEAVRARRRVDLLLARDKIREAGALPAVCAALLDRSALARALGISVAGVDRRCREGLPSVLVGERRRVRL